MGVAKYLQIECVKVPIESTTKWDAVAEVLNLLAPKIASEETPKIFAMLRRREALAPYGTYLHEFAALPHLTEVAGIEGVHLAIGKPLRPIDWEDELQQPAPTELVFLLLASGSKAMATNVLVQVSTMCRSDRFRGLVRRATSPGDLYAAVVSENEAEEQAQTLALKGVGPCEKLR